MKYTQLQTGLLVDGILGHCFGCDKLKLIKEFQGVCKCCGKGLCIQCLKKLKGLLKEEAI